MWRRRPAAGRASVMTPARAAACAHRRALRPSDKRAAGSRGRRPEKVGSGLASAIDSVPPTRHFERGAVADVALGASAAGLAAQRRHAARRFGPAAAARGRAPRRGAGSPTGCSSPRISRASRSAANTTQPIRVGAMIGAATTWCGLPPSTATPVRPAAVERLPQRAPPRGCRSPDRSPKPCRRR